MKGSRAGQGVLWLDPVWGGPASEGTGSDGWDTIGSAGSDNNSDSQPSSPVLPHQSRRPSDTSFPDPWDMVLSSLAPSKPVDVPQWSGAGWMSHFIKESRAPAAVTGIEIANLPPTVSRPQLVHLCSPFGTIAGCSFEPVGDGTLSATVTFSDSKDAAAAAAVLDGAPFLGRPLVVRDARVGY